jgi:transcription antitermination factor NusG
VDARVGDAEGADVEGVTMREGDAVRVRFGSLAGLVGVVVITNDGGRVVTVRISSRLYPVAVSWLEAA